MEDDSKIGNSGVQESALPLMPYPSQHPAPLYTQGATPSQHPATPYTQGAAPTHHPAPPYAQGGAPTHHPAPPYTQGGAPVHPQPYYPNQYAPGPQQPMVYQPTQQVVTVAPAPPVEAPLQPTSSDYMCLSVMNILCCCLPFGIVALVFSCKTQNAIARNDLFSARVHSAMALGANIMAMIVSSSGQGPRSSYHGGNCLRSMVNRILHNRSRWHFMLYTFQSGTQAVTTFSCVSVLARTELRGNQESLLMNHTFVLYGETR
ncbi:uncharacterized protein ACNLHF_002918 [Anomaloglossus baeobatrachus]|uniref:uncharacterized protein LOC142256322 n=1 Tax=Anomaloglossus baeobatrachus TaxID=238106 RepID=UPI003F502AE4